jgi:hypothetical protein
MRFKSVVEKICTSLQKTYLCHVYIPLPGVFSRVHGKVPLHREPKSKSQKARRGKENFAECQHPAKKYDMAQ